MVETMIWPVDRTLLPCPFCGGEAEEKVKGKGTANPKYYVRCKKCGCRTPETVCDPDHIYTWNERDYTFLDELKDNPGEDFYREQQKAAWDRYWEEIGEA